MLRRASLSLHPRLQNCRGFRNVTKSKVSTKKDRAGETGKDPYALFKSAIAAEPDAARIAELPESSREGVAERSRLLMQEARASMPRAACLLPRALAALRRSSGSTRTSAG